MKKTLKKIFHFILGLLFPKFCLGCHQEGSFVCEQCLKILPIQKSVSCFFCQKRLSHNFICQKCKEKYRSKIDGVFVASDWTNPLVKEIIYQYKYSFIKELSSTLAKIISEFLNREKILEGLADEKIFVPVPLSRRRLAWRGFNQAEVLAKILGADWGIKVWEILERPRSSLPQVELQDKLARQKNISNAFKLKEEFQSFNLRDKTIILIDDVSTTGATLFECAKTLKILKPKKIFGLVVARG